LWVKLIAIQSEATLQCSAAPAQGPLVVSLHTSSGKLAGILWLDNDTQLKDLKKASDANNKRIQLRSLSKGSIPARRLVIGLRDRGRLIYPELSLREARRETPSIISTR
jgi:hypothetical protein